MALELLREQTFQERRGVLLGRGIHAGGSPGFLAAFDDERGAARRVLIGVHAPQAVRSVPEIKGERRKRPCRAEPHEPVRTQIGGDGDMPSEELPHGAVRTVGGDNQIGVGKRVEARDFMLEEYVHAGGAGLLPQHVEERVPAHAAEAMPGRRDPLAAVVHLDVVPVHEVPRDLTIGLRVGVCYARHRGVREHHAESERVVRTIPLDHPNLVPRIRFLHQRGKVQTAGAAADTDNAHYRFPRSTSESRAQRQRRAQRE